jgi:hypothetical protein
MERGRSPSVSIPPFVREQSRVAQTIYVRNCKFYQYAGHQGAL